LIVTDAAFYQIMVQVLPTVLIAVILESRRALQSVNAHRRSTVEADAPHRTAYPMARATTLVRTFWTIYLLTALLFLLGEGAAVAGILSGPGGGLAVILGTLVLVALTWLCLLAVTLPVARAV
jgi:hypothetical protein